MKKEITNILTIDVEDYFQVENFSAAVQVSDWHKFESRVVKNTRKILEILADNNTKATFFVLGWVAEHYPMLVWEISKGGHEIASHGYEHSLVYKQSPDEFRYDVVRSISVLESIIDQKVRGYRAPSCSITNKSLWAFDILEDIGIEYDSSIFPIHHDRYGIPNADRCIHKTANENVVELPFSTMRCFNHNIPVAGGGYFRLYPYWITKKAIKKINSEGHPAIVYVHPWEFDPEQPRIKAGRLNTFRHYVNISTTEKKLRKLLCDFKFVPIREYLTKLANR